MFECRRDCIFAVRNVEISLEIPGKSHEMSHRYQIVTEYGRYTKL